MTNYELMHRWSRVYSVAEMLRHSEKMNDILKYRLITSLTDFAFGMYRASSERLFAEFEPIEF